MNRKNFFTVLLGFATLALTLGLNLGHAMNDYGLSGNALSMFVLAQSNGSGSGGATCTCAACASSASDDSCLYGTGWDELVTRTYEKDGSQYLWEMKVTQCAKGGPMNSCSEGRRCLQYINGKPQEWKDC